MSKRTKDFNYFSGKKYDGMMGRCYREKNKSYKSHGSRGIKVCKDWILDINKFRAWMISELDNLGISIEDFVLNKNRLQLDRIDVDGHYTPLNCRLVSPQKNARNKRTKVVKTIITAEGEEVTI